MSRPGGVITNASHHEEWERRKLERIQKKYREWVAAGKPPGGPAYSGDDEEE